jgi:hypothetical protein
MSDDSVSDTKHSPEPWAYMPLHKVYGHPAPERWDEAPQYGIVEVCEDDPEIASLGPAGNPEADARRIVACVNACAGLSTEALEAGKLGEALDALRPFARFVFGPKWVGHTIIARDGDVNVLCGYDAGDRMTGVDVNYSDFQRAARVLGRLP